MIFNFLYIFINISRYLDSNAKRNTPLYSEFYLYKMIYSSSHKFAFSNLRFSSFYEHFRQLREKYAFKLKKIKNKGHHVNKLIEPDLMMCIHITFSKSDHSTPLTYSKYSSRCEPFPLLFCKKLVGREKINYYYYCYIHNF